MPAKGHIIPAQDRFEEKVLIDYCNPTGCWLWAASKFRDGYGRMTVLDERCPRGQRSAKAHRLSFEFYKGHIPKRMQVLHHCDNPACVNPAHLFLGTNQDNMTDKIVKGRHRYNPKASRFSKDDVIRMDGLRKSGMSYQDIARQFGAYDGSTISKIVRRKTWKHIPNG